MPEGEPTHAEMIAWLRSDIREPKDDWCADERRYDAMHRAVLAALVEQRSCVQWIEGVEGVLRRAAEYLGDVEKSDEPDAPPSQLLAEIWTALNLLPLEPNPQREEGRDAGR